MFFRQLFRLRGLGINLLAGFTFLLLAVYGWGLSWEVLVQYLLIIVLLLIGIIFIAAISGWLLRKWMHNRN